ncbi:MAG: hypothetical protein ACE5K9_06500 [Candidatus Methylomirabilales bacterium]
MKKILGIPMIFGLVTAFFLAIGGPVPASAGEMMQADKAMHQATGEELMKLKQELDMIQAELQKLSARVGGMQQSAARATSAYCKSIPRSLVRAGFAPGLCQ